MYKGFFIKAITFSLALAFLTTGCRKRDDISLPDNLVVFTSDAQGISAAENSLVVKVKLSRGTDKDIPVTIHFTTDKIAYGTEFTTTPAAATGSFDITIPSGNNEASFTVNKLPGVLYDGDEKINFEIYSSGSPILIGAGKKVTLSFSELVASTGTLLINGGGVTFPNKVFIDLSANRQTSIARTNWDLGFYTDPADFRVVLNSTTGMMVKQINKNDLASVSASDTIGFTNDVAYSPFAPFVEQLAYVDYPNGDLTRTAISTIAPIASDNKVYIVNRGSGVGVPAPARGWKKIRVLRNASGGYTLQHADIEATSFTSVDVSKDATYFFKYVSFENGVIPVEPEKTKWDLAWSYFGFVTNFGSGEVPYLFQDIVSQNRNVSVAKVLTVTKTYETFTEANLTDATIPAAAWNSSQLAIGSDWRRTTPSPAQTFADRFYVVKDGNNNYYKVRFTALTDGGIRGYPSIEYALVKKG